GRLIRLVLGDAIRPAVWGIGLGLFGATFLARGLESQLYGVSTLDAWTYSAAPLILLAVALVAVLPPALRATRLEAKLALQED
ncbi:MAG: permease, partial [Acidobacteriota bacterium]